MLRLVLEGVSSGPSLEAEDDEENELSSDGLMTG
jgi:hypothetical protein